MKVFSFIASQRGVESNTAMLLNLLISEIDKILGSESLEHIFFAPSDIYLQNCTGCTSCFRKGFCPLDKKDQFGEIKKQILSSDIIILGTPVYAGMVSGNLKSFIDRLSYWTHIFPLLGAYGVPLVTASSNHLLETSEYLKYIMDAWGLCIPAEVCCTVDIPPMLRSDYFINITLSNYANEIVSKYKNDLLESSLSQEKLFETFKKIYGGYQFLDGAESQYWQKNGYFGFDSFKELLASRCRRQSMSRDSEKEMGY